METIENLMITIVYKQDWVRFSFKQQTHDISLKYILVGINFYIHTKKNIQFSKITSRKGKTDFEFELNLLHKLTRYMKSPWSTTNSFSTVDLICKVLTQALSKCFLDSLE